MKRLPLRFHHLGLAARRPEPAARFARALGYDVGKGLFDPEQSVHLCMCDHPTMPRLEIVTPGEGSGPLNGLLRTQSELLYHVCYEVESVDQVLDQLRTDVGPVRCVSEPKPAVLFDRRRVGFYMVSGIGLVEFLEAS